MLKCISAKEGNEIEEEGLPYVELLLYMNNDALYFWVIWAVLK